MQTQNKQSQARSMHKYVWILVGVWTLLVVTFAIALKRVSQSDKFAGFYVKSLTLEGQLPSKH